MSNVTIPGCNLTSSHFRLNFVCYTKKLIALVTQKFISDIAMDSMQYSRMRQAASTVGASEAARKAALLKVSSFDYYQRSNQTF